jgi:hypothetical protein
MLNETSNAGLIPLKMCAATLELDQFTPDWPLSQIEYAESDQPRTYTHHVQFDTSFSNIPLVHVGLSGFDIDNRDSARISVHTSAITSSSFDIVIKTWVNTRLYSVEISWIALGQM